MDLITLVLFIIGLGLLIGGAELLVRSASRLALVLGVSLLVVGLTVVAFGTSAPEMAVTTQSTLAGRPDLAVGNVVGSNIANVLLILGISALITPLVVAQQLARLDIPLMIGVSGVVLVMALDGAISRIEGVLLFAGIIAYTVFAIRQSRKESQAIQTEYAQEFSVPPPQRGGQTLLNVVGLLVGLALIILGARWLVDGATAAARAFGVSELIIGLTIVAVGTSLPEIATSVIASLRGERDIAVGNVVGSNIFNLLAVLGIASNLRRKASRFLRPCCALISPSCWQWRLPACRFLQPATSLPVGRTRCLSATTRCTRPTWCWPQRNTMHCRCSAWCCGLLCCR